MNIEKLKEELWGNSRPAEDINVDWISIPTLDAIEIINKFVNSEEQE